MMCRQETRAGRARSNETKRSESLKNPAGTLKRTEIHVALKDGALSPYPAPVRLRLPPGLGDQSWTGRERKAEAGTAVRWWSSLSEASISVNDLLAGDINK